MARGPIKDRDTEAVDILQATGVVTEDDLGETDAGSPPPYTLVGGASIPVSRKAGARWKEKIDGALTAYDLTRQSWDAAYKDYRACNMYDSVKGDTVADRGYFQNNTDENLTRENVKTLLRNTYTKNPNIELSSIDKDDEDKIDVFEAAINELLNRVHAPGLNAKARIRRWITHAHLTNFGIIRLDFQDKVGSRADAQEQLLRLQEKMKDEKDERKLDELYAELEVVEESLPTMRDPGMVLKNIASGYIIIDPDTTTTDLSDCKWLDEVCYLSEAYIKKHYMKKDEEGKWVRLSDGKPAGNGLGTTAPVTDDVRENVANMIMGHVDESIADERNKGKIKCHLIWDKLTKQISLWQDGDWSYPLWVFEDNLKLSRFYQHFVLFFSEPLDSIVQDGESAQYSGQVKEINKINQRIAYLRRLAYGALIYNSKKIEKDSVQKVINFVKNPNEFEALGVEWDPEVPLREMFDVFVPPDYELQPLFDKGDLMRTIDRISSTPAVARGDQFKTNTTNKAVDAYQGVMASVSNELTDAIEDALNSLIHSMLEILVSKYTKEQVIELVGRELGEAFEPLTVLEFNQTFSLRIASGSTVKPTSDNKKQEAIQLAQTIGQVGQAAPGATLKIMFRMFREAFASLFMFGKRDEELLAQEVAASMQKGVSTQGGQNPEQPPAKPANGVQ